MKFLIIQITMLLLYYACIDRCIKSWGLHGLIRRYHVEHILDVCKCAME
jgi:hypothetical protein